MAAARGFAQQQCLDIHSCQVLLQPESMLGRIFQSIENKHYLFVTKTCPRRPKVRSHALRGMLSTLHPQTYPQQLWISGKPVRG